MKKTTFTPDGIQDLLAALYLLPPKELQLQIDALSANFKLWVLAHFELDGKQVRYLEGLSSSTTRYLAAVCSICLENRSDITLVKNSPNLSGTDRRSKSIRASNTVVITPQHSDLNAASSVMLTFEIFYQP